MTGYDLDSEGQKITRKNKLEKIPREGRKEVVLILERHGKLYIKKKKSGLY